ncbi:MAG: WecB/TagA/CpsF family glycosyltransferase [Oscillospiraceae bacterium]|nr:WecB/TagA/CpsF family glycosyltransferase [Oscillospiraceae bacterium]
MRVNILGVGFDNYTMAELVEKGTEFLCSDSCHYVVTPNPEIVETCRENAEAMRAVNGADLVIPDGIGVIYGAKILKTPLKERTPGIEFGEHMIAKCAELGKSVFFLGAKPGVADAAAENMKKKYPALTVAGTNDGYFKEDGPVVEKVRASGADLLFVCLGAPKQEFWMEKNGKATGAKLMMGLGGSLDVWAGTVQRAPEFYIRHNLEWFYRLIKNPSRIGRMMKLPLFLIHVIFGGKKG